MEQDVAAIRRRIKEIVGQVTGLAPEEIGDSASLVDDLDLDSLALMEIGVDVDYEYRLGLSEEALTKIGSVDDAVKLVTDSLAGSAVA